MRAVAERNRSTDWALTGRQLLGTLRLDLRRSLLSPRVLAALFLAFAPLALVAIVKDYPHVVVVAV